MYHDDVLIDGDRAVVIARLRGTHSGDFFGLAPTGRHMELQAALVLTIADGLVIDERRIYDFTGVLVQVGVLKAKPSGNAGRLAIRSRGHAAAILAGCFPSHGPRSSKRAPAWASSSITRRC